MFTGIIQAKGTVLSIDHSRGDARFKIQTKMRLDNVAIGASICHSGCCLTIVEKNADTYSVDVSAETLSKTTLGQWKEGTLVNLEPSLKLGDELGGHIVSGHVDSVATITSIIPEGDSHRLVIKAPQNLAKFIAPKGSVALDGISLTVNNVDGHLFGINIIPHTWEVTSLGQKKVGDSLNIEIDLMARYAARLMEYV
jgi:riboflavin synthase